MTSAARLRYTRTCQHALTVVSRGGAQEGTVIGQYFKIANLDKREYLDPHAFGDGLKLLEFGCSSMGTLLGLTLLLRSSDEGGGGDFGNRGEVPSSAWERIGSWAGDRVVICGDYDAPGKWIDDEIRAHPLYLAQHMEAVAYNAEHGASYDPTPTLYSLCGSVFRDISGEIIEIAQLGGEPIRYAEEWSSALDHDPERRDRIRANGETLQAYRWDKGATLMRPDMVLTSGQDS